jgi:flagellar biogenesis protein FliO
MAPGAAKITQRLTPPPRPGRRALTALATLLCLLPVGRGLSAAELTATADTVVAAESGLQSGYHAAEDTGRPAALTGRERRSPSPGPRQPHPPELPWARVVWGLAVVVLLILGGVGIMKKLNGGLPVGRGRYMKLLETMPVGGKVHLFLVQVGDKVVMVAANGENVSAVTEFDADEMPEVEPSERLDALAGFKSILGRVRGGS